ncbi:hypothetical protein GGI24_005419, partial [Coemansia furcata]
MEHNNSNGRNGNVPLGSLPPPGNQYIYNSYIDSARMEGAAPSSPSSIVFMAQTPAASGSNAAPIGFGSNLRTQNAPSTAASDRSFHAIMIGDNGAQAPARQSSLAAAAGNSHAPPLGVHPRLKQSFDTSNMSDMQGSSSLSASLPSGNPFLHGSGDSRDPVAPGTEHRMANATHSRIAYPPLNIVSSDEWAAALPSLGVSQSQHTRAGSQQHAPLSS